MKHLKSYTLYEKVSKETKLFESIDANIKSDIEDIVIELTDCEIYYEISDRKYWKYWKNSFNSEEALIIYLRDNQRRFFTIKDIEDVLLRLKDYLKMTDYSIDLSIPDSDDYLTFDEFIEEFSGEELYHVNMIVYYNPRISSFQRKYTAHEDFYESNVLNQSIIDDCKDILLELEDIGIKTNIHSHFNTGISLVKKESDWKVISTMNKQVVDVNTSKYNKNWITVHLNRKEEFTYSDIEDAIERLKSYLSEFGLHIQWQSPTERKEQRPTIKTTRVMDPTTFTPQGVRTECELYFNQK